MWLEIFSRLVRVVASFARRGFQIFRRLPGSFPRATGGWMESEDYLVRVEKHLNFVLSYINPFVVIGGERKLSKRVVACLCLQHLGWISTVVHTIGEFSSRTAPDLSEKSELIAVALLSTRCICYSGSVISLGSRMKSLIQRVIADREASRSSSAAWQLAFKYSKTEFLSSMGFALYVLISPVLVIFAPVFMPNQLVLVYNFKIPLLQFDDVFSANWYLTYLLQASMAIIYASFYTCFVSLMLHFMDHSCWTIDNLMILVEELRSSSDDHDRNDPESAKSVQKRLKLIVRKSYEALEWQNEVRDLLKNILMLEFSLQAIMTGLSLSTLANSLKASSTCYVVPLIFLPQIFVNCWMGERYVNRIEKISAAVYDLPWYVMDAKQRKEVLMILIMSQNMQSFDGIFYQVNMETFQGVLKLTYSFIMLLKSMNLPSESVT